MKIAKFAFAAFAAVVLTACGGGGGGTNQVVTSPTPTSQIVGTAATGAALASAQVVVSNAAGTSPCVETSITTNGLGSYTCTLKAGEIAPFFIVVTDPTGNTTPLVSIATTTPTAGTPLTVNATPLTTAIVAQLNNGDALGVVADKTKYNAANLNAISSNVLNQLSTVLNSIGAPSNYDPFTTSITAASSTQVGNTADQVLDVIKITKTAANALAFSTISDSTPIQMATAVSAGSSVQAATSSVSDLSQAAVLAAQAFNKCFALSTSNRVTVVNSAITAVAADCQSIVTSENNPSGAPAFKHNGYSANQVFFNYLTSDAMTGAKFSVPEIMAFYPATNASPRDKAVLNIRYIDNQNIPSNIITIAQNFPNSSTTSRPSNWWITGNQWNYDISIQPQFRKVKDWLNANNSGYQNGLDFNIRSTSGAPLSSTFDSVLVTGRGLPTNGLWMVRSTAGYTGGFVVAQSRAAPPQQLSSLIQVCNACVTFWISRTAGITDAAASTLRSNNSASMQWAHQSDGSYDGNVESNRPLKGDKYVFSMYKNGALVATEFRTLLTDLTSAVNMKNMAWHENGSNTIAAFDSSNASLSGLKTTLLVDWISNPNAELIDGIWISQTDGNYDNATKFSLGATSVLAAPRGAIGTYFTSLTGVLNYDNPPLDGFREIDMHYRTTDGTKKVMSNYYYP